MVEDEIAEGEDIVFPEEKTEDVDPLKVLPTPYTPHAAGT